MNKNDFIRTVSASLLQEKESVILKELNKLVDKGLLVVVQKEPVLTREKNSNEVKVSQEIGLILKDQEYINKLEEENKKLREIVGSEKFSI